MDYVRFQDRPERGKYPPVVTLFHSTSLLSIGSNMDNTMNGLLCRHLAHLRGVSTVFARDMRSQ